MGPDLQKWHQPRQRLRGHPTQPSIKMRTRRRFPSAGEASISGGRSLIPALVAAGPPAAPPSQYQPNGEKLIAGDRRWRPPSARGAGWSDRFDSTTNRARGRAQNPVKKGAECCPNHHYWGNGGGEGRKIKILEPGVGQPGETWDLMQQSTQMGQIWH